MIKCLSYAPLHEEVALAASCHTAQQDFRRAILLKPSSSREGGEVLADPDPVNVGHYLVCAVNIQ